MIVIRSAEPKDFAALRKLSRHLHSYNFPDNPAELRGLLRLSCDSFSGKIRDPFARVYVFVAENTAGEILGSSMLIARHGTPRMPHLSFRAQGSGARATLKLSVDRVGFTEVGGLVVLPRHRHSTERIGRKLSLARFAYLAAHPHFFCRRVLVEYLPPLDKNGNALWRALGGPLTGLSYADADHLSVSTKDFILDLFPKTPILVSRLPAEARQVIGMSGPGAEASRHMVEKIGFKYLNQVDPFDGGPHYGAELRKISLVRRTKRLRITGDILEKRGLEFLVLKEKSGRVRIAVSQVEPAGAGRVRIAREASRALGLKPGDTASFTPF